MHSFLFLLWWLDRLQRSTRARVTHTQQQCNSNERRELSRKKILISRLDQQQQTGAAEALQLHPHHFAAKLQQVNPKVVPNVPQIPIRHNLPQGTWKEHCTGNSRPHDSTTQQREKNGGKNCTHFAHPGIIFILVWQQQVCIFEWCTAVFYSFFFDVQMNCFFSFLI